MSLQRRRTLLCAALAAALLLSGSGTALPASLAEELEGERFLPIGLTPEEEGMLDRIGERHRGTPPPSAPVRNPGEFEPMTGVIVRYPFGNPTDLMVEMAEDVTLWVIVEDAGDQSAAYSMLEGAGCNMSHVDFIFGPTNSIWTRDYGPWFIVGGDYTQGIVDHIYNRPRPDDDLIPGVIGSAWGIPVYGMDLEHTGGNYMSDGRGGAMSTRLVLDENTSLSSAEVDSIVHAYLGIEQYEKLPYVETGGIHHIDCWAKFLSPDKILVKEVDPGHADYGRIESNVAYLSSIPSSYGRPYEIVRVYTPNDEPYTNSLILNDKVFVPMFGTSNDADALTTYEAAMPGYEVLGYSGSWYTNDAIHCRTMGVTDRYMLCIDHVPLFDTADTADSYRVASRILDYSESGLVADSLLVHWRIDSAPDFTTEVMAAGAADTYYAYIPPQSAGTEVYYYITALDSSGRREAHPYVAPGDAHSFEVLVDTVPPAIAHTSLGDVQLACWPPTAVATVTDNVEVTSVTLESWINGSPQSDVGMSRVGTTFDYEGTFPGSVVVGDVVTYRITAEDAASPPNIAAEPDTGTHAFDILEEIPVVIWEPESTPLSGPALSTLLDGMGIAYDYTTTVPDFGDYDAAFVCLGVYDDNYVLNTTEANAVVDYLDAGGRVYMEGGDCWAYDASRTIYDEHFGIDEGQLADGTGDVASVDGEAGTFTEGMSFSYGGGNSYMDHIEPLPGAVAIFTNPSDGAGAGVANEDVVYRTVACAFEFGGLVDAASPSTKADLLIEILAFFGITETGVPGSDEQAPLSFGLAQNRPNPFNPTTTIAYELPVTGRVELAVYTPSGRKVVDLVARRVEAGRHTATWNGVDGRGRPVASGVYLIRLSHGGEHISRKCVLLK